VAEFGPTSTLHHRSSRCSDGAWPASTELARRGGGPARRCGRFAVTEHGNMFLVGWDLFTIHARARGAEPDPRLRGVCRPGRSPGIAAGRSRARRRINLVLLAEKPRGAITT